MDEAEVKSLEDDPKDTEKVEEQEEGEDFIDDEENFAQRLAEMEEEAKMLSELQNQVDHQISMNVDKEEVDSRSVYVGNVDYSCTNPKELEDHFAACGTILRVTIMCDKWTGQPKGFAYVEFMDKSSVANAVELNESIFKGRPLKVTPKRTNVPSFMLRGRGTPTRGRRPRGRRPRGRRGYYNPYY